MKSDIEIAKFLYHQIKGSELNKSVSGKLSDRGRPSGSDKEDIVISVLANDGCGEIQLVYVNVNIYVKDTYNSITKSWEQSTQRLAELCEQSKWLFSLYDGPYRVFPDQCSQKVFETGVIFEDGHSEHFINNKLFIKISNDY